MVPASVELGNKAVIASGCAIGEHTVVGDKSSVKRSVVGASCRCSTSCLFGGMRSSALSAQLHCEALSAQPLA